MNNNIKVFKFFNTVIIIDNGIKKIITDKNIITKSKNEILVIYNNRRKCGDKNE